MKKLFLISLQIFLFISCVCAQEFSIVNEKHGGFINRALKFSKNLNYSAFALYLNSNDRCSMGISQINDTDQVVSIDPINNSCESGKITAVLDISDAGDVVFITYKEGSSLEYFYYKNSTKQITNLFNLPQISNDNLFIYYQGSILKNGNIIIGDKYIEFQNNGSFLTTSLSDRFGVSGLFLPTENGTFLGFIYDNCITKFNKRHCEISVKEFSETGSILFSQQLSENLGNKADGYSYFRVNYNNFSKIIIDASGAKDKPLDRYFHLFTYDTSAQKLDLLTTNFAKIIPLSFAVGSPNYDKFTANIIPKLIQIDQDTNGFGCLLPQSLGYANLGQIIGIRQNDDIIVGNSRRNFNDIADYYNNNHYPGNSNEPNWEDLSVLRPDYSKSPINYCVSPKNIKVSTKGRCKYLTASLAKKYSKVTRDNFCEVTVTADSQLLREVNSDKTDMNINYAFFKSNPSNYRSKLVYQKSYLLKYKQGKWIAKFKIPLKKFGRKQQLLNFGLSLFIGDSKFHSIFGFPFTPIDVIR